MSLYSSRLYRHSPVLLQNAAISFKGLLSRVTRRSRRFSKVLAQIRARETLTVEGIRDFQCRELQFMIAHATRNVPYYRKLFEESGLSESMIQSPDDLKKLPYLEKETVRTQASQFVPTNLKKWQLIRAGTSGSSGTPLQLYRTLDSVIYEHGYVWRQFAWAGGSLGNRIVALRGDVVVPSSQRTPPFWRHNLAENALIMSSYHIAEDTIPLYLAAIRDFQPTLIYSYPSAVYPLAEHIVRRKLAGDFRSLNGVVTSSETLLPLQREVIEEAMGCRVFDWYGQGERVVFIGTCEHGSHHVFDDYGVTEFIPIGDSTYELVGTGFTNYGMPLIRYKTGDLVELGNQDRCPCGQAFKVVASVEGRKEDMIELRSGKLVGRMDLIFKGLEGIREAQIIQQTFDDIVVRIVVDESFAEGTLRKINGNARVRLGDEVRVRIEIVDSIPRGTNGKFKAVVSLLNREDSRA